MKSMGTHTHSMRARGLQTTLVSREWRPVLNSLIILNQPNVVSWSVQSHSSVLCLMLPAIENEKETTWKDVQMRR
jgi:hypothetical protein